MKKTSNEKKKFFGPNANPEKRFFKKSASMETHPIPYSPSGEWQKSSIPIQTCKYGSRYQFSKTSRPDDISTTTSQSDGLQSHNDGAIQLLAPNTTMPTNLVENFPPNELAENSNIAENKNDDHQSLPSKKDSNESVEMKNDKSYISKSAINGDQQLKPQPATQKRTASCNSENTTSKSREHKVATNADDGGVGAILRASRMTPTVVSKLYSRTIQKTSNKIAKGEKNSKLNKHNIKKTGKFKICTSLKINTFQHFFLSGIQIYCLLLYIKNSKNQLFRPFIC